MSLRPMIAVGVVGVASIAVCVVGALVGIFVHGYSEIPCECPSIQDESRCKDIPFYMKVPLIATHLTAFILLPASMWVWQAGAGVLQKQMGMKSPVQVVLGLAYFMVSIAGEMGWHVHQRWFYDEGYDVLNFFFYALFTLGTSLWALGVQTEATKSTLLDALLLLCSPVIALIYAWAAYASYNNLDSTKVPIYILMTYQFGLLSWRLFKLLNNDFKVWLFPFFSVGVNLFFVSLLNKHQNNVVLNPLFHMLHDAAGTLLGILIITLVLWSAISKNSQLDTKKIS